MTYKLGLTGSIGMGKSTTAGFFAQMGCAVWDADAAVHRLYQEGGKAVALLGAELPEAIESNAVSRERLKDLILDDPDVLKILERIVHPLVGQDRADFVANCDADIIVFDIPLLFETGGNRAMDAVVCVSAPPDVQKSRVMARGTMTEGQFLAILKKQMPSEEKCARADFVVLTDTLEHARAQVVDIVSQIRSRQNA